MDHLHARGYPTLTRATARPVPPIVREAASQTRCEDVHMIELLRSNDSVLMSFVTSVLRDAGIEHSVADGHMSVIDGSIGAVSNRIMVADDQIEAARQLLADAGVPTETP
jgi:hypothetical protein